MTQLFSREQQSNISFLTNQENNHKVVIKQQQKNIYQTSSYMQKINKPNLKPNQHNKCQNKEFPIKKHRKYIEKVDQNSNQQQINKKNTVQSIEYKKKHYIQKVIFNNISANYVDNQIKQKQLSEQVSTDLVLIQYLHTNQQWNQSTSFQTKQFNNVNSSKKLLQNYNPKKNNRIFYVEKQKYIKKQNIDYNNHFNNQNEMTLINQIQSSYTNLNFTTFQSQKKKDINQPLENILDLSIIIPCQQPIFKIIDVNIERDQDTQKNYSFQKIHNSIDSQAEQYKKSLTIDNQESIFYQENLNNLSFDQKKVIKDNESIKQLLSIKNIYIHVKFKNILELSILKIIIGKQQQKFLCKKLYLNQIQRNPFENSTIPLQINCYERKFTNFYIFEDQWLFGKAKQKIQFEEIKLKCSDCKKYLKMLADCKGCLCPYCSTVIQCQIEVKQQYDLY